MKRSYWVHGTGDVWSGYGPRDEYCRVRRHAADKWEIQYPDELAGQFYRSSDAALAAAVKRHWDNVYADRP